MSGWGAAASGAVTMLGGYFQNQAQAQSAETANNFAANQRATAYQTTVNDMKAAGLNPMLAYSQGATSTPGSSMAQMSNILGPAVSSAISGYKDLSTTDLIKEQVANVGSDTDKKDAETANTQMDTKLKQVFGLQGLATIRSINASTDYTRTQKDLATKLIANAIRTGANIEANTGNTKLDSLLKTLDVPEAQGRANAMKGGLGDIKPYLDTGGKLLHSAGSLIRATR